MTSEHHIQTEFFKWCKLMSTQKGYEPLKLIFAIPNGGHRNIITAKRLKDEGVRAGVPDIFLPYPCHGFHGLFLETKSEKGKLTFEQGVFLCAVHKLGYATAVCFSTDELREKTSSYLAGNFNL